MSRGERPEAWKPGPDGTKPKGTKGTKSDGTKGAKAKGSAKRATPKGTRRKPAELTSTFHFGDPT